MALDGGCHIRGEVLIERGRRAVLAGEASDEKLQLNRGRLSKTRWLQATRVKEAGEAPDPWTGRLGLEVLPGVFNGRILGQRDSDASITLYAYVYGPENPGIRNWDLTREDLFPSHRAGNAGQTLIQTQLWLRCGPAIRAVRSCSPHLD